MGLGRQPTKRLLGAITILVVLAEPALLRTTVSVASHSEAAPARAWLDGQLGGAASPTAGQPNGPGVLNVDTSIRHDLRRSDTDDEQWQLSLRALAGNETLNSPFASPGRGALFGSQPSALNARLPALSAIRWQV